MPYPHALLDERLQVSEYLPHWLFACLDLGNILSNVGDLKMASLYLS